MDRSTPADSMKPNAGGIVMQLHTTAFKEKLSGLEQQNRRLQKRNRDLQHSLEDMDDEQADVFVYIHEKLDEYYEQISQYEEKTARLERELQRVEEQKERSIAQGREAAEQEARRLQRDLEYLRDQLLRVQSFQKERETVLEQVEDLRTQLESQSTSADLRVATLERKHIAERQRLKGEMLERLRETKEAILAETVQQLHDTTKRTLAENEQMTTELAYQSREVEKLVQSNNDLREENQRLRRQESILQRTVDESAQRTHLLDAMVKTLHRKVRRLEAEATTAHDPQKEQEQEAKEGGNRIIPPNATGIEGDDEGESPAHGRSPHTERTAAVAEVHRLRQRVRRLESRVRTAEADVAGWRRAWEDTMGAQRSGIGLLTEAMRRLEVWELDWEGVAPSAGTSVGRRPRKTPTPVSADAPPSPGALLSPSPPPSSPSSPSGRLERLEREVRARNGSALLRWMERCGTVEEALQGLFELLVGTWKDKCQWMPPRANPPETRPPAMVDMPGLRARQVRSRERGETARSKSSEHRRALGPGQRRPVAARSRAPPSDAATTPRRRKGTGSVTLQSPLGEDVASKGSGPVGKGYPERDSNASLPTQLWDVKSIESIRIGEAVSKKVPTPPAQRRPPLQEKRDRRAARLTSLGTGFR